MVLNALSTGPFYQKYVQLPAPDAPVPPFIANNPKFFPFFCNAIGAIDGTHINCCPSAADRHAARNRKGVLTQNCLACVSWDMKFLYMISGWEGSAADATLYAHSCFTDLPIISLLANITWQMLGLVHVILFLFHTVECAITWQSGVGLTLGMY